MSLMDRIKVIPFSSYSNEKKFSFIEKLQRLRTNDQIEARSKALKGNTKSSRKNKAKKGKRIIDPKKAAALALSKLSPEALQQLIRRVT